MTKKADNQQQTTKRITATPERLGPDYTPPKRQRTGKWSARLAQASGEPGVWYGVTLGSGSTVSSTIHKLRKAHQDFEFAKDGLRVSYRKLRGER